MKFVIFALAFCGLASAQYSTPIQTTLANSIGDNNTQPQLASVAGIVPGNLVYIDREAMAVNGITVATGRLAVQRGALSTRISGHLAAAVVYAAPPSSFITVDKAGSCGSWPAAAFLINSANGNISTCTASNWVVTVYGAAAAGGGAPSGPAGGSLTGSYPNPGLGPVASTNTGAIQSATSGGALQDSGCIGLSGAVTCPGSLTSGNGTGVAGAQAFLPGTFPTLPVNSFSFVAPTSLTGSLSLTLPSTIQTGMMYVSSGVISMLPALTYNPGISSMFLSAILRVKTGSGQPQTTMALDGTIGMGIDDAGSMDMNIGVKVPGVATDSKFHIAMSQSNGAWFDYLNITPITGVVTIPFLHSTTGARYVCVNTTGALVSQAAACSGT